MRERKNQYDHTKHSRQIETAASKKKILIAAHRGTKGANIIENTVDAFDCAIQNDADIMELDIVSSTDGILYVFHDGTRTDYSELPSLSRK